MASEDVLDRAREFTSSPKRYLAFEEIDAKSIALVIDLAAEVRELRKDKARLDWMINKWPWYDQDGPPRDREEIDAAMGEPQND